MLYNTDVLTFLRVPMGTFLRFNVSATVAWSKSSFDNLPRQQWKGKWELTVCGIVNWRHIRILINSSSVCHCKHCSSTGVWAQLTHVYLVSCIHINNETRPISRCNANKSTSNLRSVLQIFLFLTYSHMVFTYIFTLTFIVSTGKIAFISIF